MPSFASLAPLAVRHATPVPPPEPCPRHTAPRLARGVLEDTNVVGDVRIVSLRMEERVAWSAGQYARVLFDGFPARAFHLSKRLDGSLSDREVVLHVRARPDGQLGPAFGDRIRAGHSLVLQVPLGEAFDERTCDADFACDGEGLARLWALFGRSSFRCGQGSPLVHLAGSDRIDCRYVDRMKTLLRERGVRVVPLAAGTKPRRRPLVVTGEDPLIERLSAVALRAGLPVHAPRNDWDHTGRPFDAPRPNLREMVGARLAGLPLAELG